MPPSGAVPMKTDKVFWDAVDSPLGEAYLAVTSAGVCRFDLPNHSRTSFLSGLRRTFLDAEPVEDAGAVSDAAAQLREYWEGRSTRFTFSLDLRGTEFQRAVWKALAQIPYGQTRTYGEVARAIGSPGAAQAVGRAVGANPVALFIPCHRVIGADGSMTGFAAGIDTKEWLLRHEGALTHSA